MYLQNLVSIGSVHEHLNRQQIESDKAGFILQYEFECITVVWETIATNISQWLDNM